MDDAVHALTPAAAERQPLMTATRPPDLAAAERAYASFLDALGVPVTPHTADTPRRVAKMFCHEVFAGLYEPPPPVTAFAQPQPLDQVYAVGPAAFRSICAHHAVPIIGHAWIALKPGVKLIGLSKFSRVAAWVMARPQVQEEATEQLADMLWDETQPEALAVIVRARHFCCAWRGIRDDGQLMMTSVMRGRFREDPAMRREVLSLLAGLGAGTL
jgi:GTP cyclohydrolase I